uniref:AlNc14C69G4815 protein n=1 Tax=Albugo laibachii Nc14 TaxID=890382 RepID=F0WDU7_9STRA|nr:AlNc14C69G4815 [Albugo laibachii Nc14]|eukprot:CCA19374.1 AlNc14C69G4815 [Albugo laibachii Nc14]
MKNLQMMQERDGKSRLDCLIRDFMNILDDQDMENFDEKEPKLCIKCLLYALRPPVLQDTVRSELKRQSNRKYKTNMPEFVAWLKSQVVEFDKFDPALMSMTNLSGAGRINNVLPHPKRSKNTEATGGRHTYSNLGNRNGIEKDQNKVFNGEETQDKENV